MDLKPIFEYKALTVDALFLANSDRLEAILNGLGQENWELVGFDHVGPQAILIFKRFKLVKP